MEYSKGKIVEGKIIHVAEEYLLVKFPNKETGILHKSKISPQPECDLTNLYRRNQSILVSIDRISEKGYTLGQKDIDNRYENQLRHKAKELEKLQRAEERERMKELVENSASKFIRGGIYEAEVISLSNQVAKISIDGIDGYIKKDELNWNENDSVKESLFEGEIIHAVFLEYTDGKLWFGLKYLEEKPYDDNLYSLSTDELLKRLGHNNNVFIAEAKNIKGLCLTNLYSEEGNLLIDPVKGNNIVVKVVQPIIEEGKFYKVRIELLKEEERRNNNDLFSFFVSSAEEVINPYKSDVDLAFCKHTSPATNSSIANLLDEVGLNMYSSPERMFFELIQNADDAASENGVIINIDKVENYLVFTHNGFHFSRNDFESIVSAAKSTKTSKEKTGYKGIGFKSVFTNSQQVYVHSGGYHFLFDKNTELYDDFDGFYFRVNKKFTKEEQCDFIRTFQSEKKSFRGVKDIPWQLLPIWYDAIPETLKKSAFAKNQKVSFALNIKNQKIEDYVKAIEFLFDNPKFILFLRHTNRLDLKFANKTITKDIKDGIVTIKNSFANKRTETLIKRDYENIPISNEAFEDKDIDVQIKEITNRQGEKEIKFYDNNNQELEEIPDRIASSQTTTISFVANYDEGIITENKGNSLYAYLPMNEHRFRFPFYINADFVLAANRETLLDSPWNYYLLANIGQLFVEWVAELANKGERNCLKLLPLQYFDDSTLDVEQLAQSFNSAYRTALETEAFILNHKSELARQDEIIIDKTGLSEIVGADHFCQLLGTEKSLPSEKIDSKILEEDIFEYIETMKFDVVIEAITNNSDFNDWYTSASDDDKTALYKWVEDKKKTHEDKLESFVSYLPLFKFGEEYKSCEEIEASDYTIMTEQLEPIRKILSKLGFICSDNLFDENHPLYEFADLQDDEDLFKAIKECDFSGLEADERKALFFALADFDGVGEAKLKKEIALFKNMNDEFKPLCEMIAYREDAPKWLYDYVLCKDDNCDDLSNYIIDNEKEFEDVVQKHFEDLDVSYTELYETYKEKWSGKFTRTLIDNREVTAELLSIIENSDTTTKEHFLNSIKKLELQSTSTYKKDSYEYHVLQLALSVLDNPSSFSSKVFFDGKCIADFSISDDVICNYYQYGETKTFRMSLAKLLPEFQNQSDSIEKVKALFENNNFIDKFFIAKRLPNKEILSIINNTYYIERERKVQIKGTGERRVNSWGREYFVNPRYKTEKYYVWNNSASAYQYLFCLLQYTYHVDELKINLEYKSDDFVIELMDSLYQNDVVIANSFIHNMDCYLTKKVFNSKYAFDKELLIPSIKKWANNEEKKKYLKKNGVLTSDCPMIRFRKLFLQNGHIDFIDNLSDEDIESGLKFISIVNGFERPFIGENQRETLLLIKKESRCKLSSYWNLDKIKKLSKELSFIKYQEWVEKNNINIYIYPDILPLKLFYNNELLLYYTDTSYSYYYNKSEKNIYVCNTRKIEDVLYEVAKEGKSDFGFDDYWFLFWDGKVPLTKEEIDDYDNLKEEKDKIKLALQKRGLNYDDLLKGDNINEVDEGFDGPIIKKAPMSPLGDGRKKDAQMEAQRKLQEMFPNWEYPDGFGNGGVYSTFEVIKGNDIVMPVVLKSHKAFDEPLKINPNEWDYLMDGAKLFIYTGSDIKELDPKYLIEKQPKIALSFSTENLDIEERITAFSDSLHYFKELSFDFESFNLSEKAKSIEGIYNKNEGLQNSTSDNDL